MKKGHNRLESDGVDALGTVFSDEGKIRQVLLNLLSNAARFTERGTIRIEAAHADDTLTIRVRDTGVGMSPEQLQRVFTPYAQASAGTSARLRRDRPRPRHLPRLLRAAARLAGRGERAREGLDVHGEAPRAARAARRGALNPARSKGRPSRPSGVASPPRLT